MRILIAADSFKEALAAGEVCQALRLGVLQAMPTADVVCCPLADGGEGTMSVLSEALGLQTMLTTAVDSLGRSAERPWYLSADGNIAFIEMATTAGLQLLTPSERDPLQTTTFGVGQHIIAACEQGAKEIVLAIGGSATNDAGIGMATALGWQFLNAQGMPVQPTGGGLSQISKILPPKQPITARVRVICDVTNPLFGPTGAAFIYGPQKGADAATVEILDAGLRHLSALIAQQLGTSTDPNTAGCGAAGGMGYGAQVFLQATLVPGADLMMDLLQFDDHLATCDLLLTGEGKIDGQTAHGKLIHRLCQRAARYNVPVWGFCGLLEADADTVHDIGLQAAYNINEHTQDLPLSDLLAKTAQHLTETAHRVIARHPLALE
jgi:glycerate 2-kinase